MIYQGLASCEILHLRIHDIDLDEGTIFVSSSKNHNQRTLSFKTKQIRLFQKYISENRPFYKFHESKSFLQTLRSDHLCVESMNDIISNYKLAQNSGFIDENRSILQYELILPSYFN